MAVKEHSPKVRKAVLAYAEKHKSVAMAAARFKLHKSLIYAWRDKASGEKRALEKAAKRGNGRSHPISARINMRKQPADAEVVEYDPPSVHIRIEDIITYADKVMSCAEQQDLEGIQLYVTHIKRAALGKD
jgi:transposase-like protein